jgi:arylsulfatase A-like enzyme
MFDSPEALFHARFTIHMNVIIICSDTFRYDHLGFVGRQQVATPNLDRLARESASFADFRLCSFPTLVNRIEVFTGRCAFPFTDWGPLPYHYPVLAEVFKQHDFVTGLVCDNPHLMKRKFGFGRGFDFVKAVPGQVPGQFRPVSDPMLDVPCPAEKLAPSPEMLDRYRRNAYWYRQRGTNTTETLFREAMRWLDAAPARFFLWVDAFDPHEPWDAPARYLEPYPWDEEGEPLFWPRSGRAGAYSEADLTNMRSLYKAEVTQIDHWVGELLNRLEQRRLLDHTAVIFCSDHGFLLGELGLIGKLIGKPPELRKRIGEHIGHLPLLIRHPERIAAGRTIPHLCQPQDLYATALDLAGIPGVSWAHGNSLAPRLHGEPGNQRFAVSGSFPFRHRGNGNRQTVWTDEWCFIYSPLDGLDGSELFHRATDPTLERNVIAQYPGIAEEHFAQLCSWLDGLRVPRWRRESLLQATPFTWLRRARHRAWKLRNRLHYLHCHRSYARQTVNPDLAGVHAAAA